jgi:hypothetical protein
MKKIVTFFKSFTIIFYFKFFELNKDLFGSIKIWKDLNLNRSQPRRPVTVALGPTRQRPSPPLFGIDRARHALPAVWG